MKIKKIQPSSVTAEEIAEYRNRISKLPGNFFTANDVNMDKRIITLRLEDELTLVNPTLKSVSDDYVVYYEKDTRKKDKVRKTVRAKSFIVSTDNLGEVEFSATKDKWETIDDLMTDEGLLECVMAQRLLDAIDGIDVSSPLRLYNQPAKSEKKYGRNERVMLQGPNGEMQFVKYKNAKTWLEQGYNIL